MNKFLTIAIGVVCLTGSAVFAGEFQPREFMKLWQAKDFAGMKTYAEANQQFNNSKIYQAVRSYIGCKLILKGKTDRGGDGSLDNSNFFSFVDQQLEQFKDLTPAEKLAVKVDLYQNGYWFLSHWSNDVFKHRNNALAPLATDENIESLKKVYIQGSNIFVLAQTRSDFNQKIVSIAQYAPYSALQYAIKNNLEKEKIEKVADIFNKNIADIVKTPSMLTNTLKLIGTLNDPAYDEIVKKMLVMLNRVCYPKIQQNEQWKAAVVQLQLIMKSYGM